MAAVEKSHLLPAAVPKSFDSEWISKSSTGALKTIAGINDLRTDAACAPSPTCTGGVLIAVQLRAGGGEQTHPLIEHLASFFSLPKHVSKRKKKD